jgi:hypothetical protein
MADFAAATRKIVGWESFFPVPRDDRTAVAAMAGLGLSILGFRLLESDRIPQASLLGSSERAVRFPAIPLVTGLAEVVS